MSFINVDFLLQNRPAQRLYHEFSKHEPIFDYHCHLPPEDVANNRRFKNLYEIWLDGDHYKWRAMRSNGIPERFCTGDAEPYEKFLAFCKTVPHAVRNPLYHWCHLELKRYFDIDLTINPENAKAIWEKANACLAEKNFSAHGILKRFKVALIGTTDDPTDTLEHHKTVAGLGIDTRMIPTFRPDKGLKVDDLSVFNPWTDKLAEVSGVDCSTFAGFLKALEQRHDFFHEMGGRASDHGLERAYFAETTEAKVSEIYDRARAGKAANEAELEQFAFFVMRHVGRLNHARGWTMQLHVGGLRNNSTRNFRTLGADAGFDSIADTPQAKPLSRFLDSLDIDEKLPKTIIYNLNAADNYLMASMIGNFQDGSIPGKIQFGSGWWFNDQKEAMEWQINALSNLGLLSRFVGMLTDSRSFLSYCRHEYFRRILCNVIGQDVVNGELPEDYALLGDLVRRISFGNARDYFGVEIASIYKK